MDELLEDLKWWLGYDLALLTAMIAACIVSGIVCLFEIAEAIMGW